MTGLPGGAPFAAAAAHAPSVVVGLDVGGTKVLGVRLGVGTVVEQELRAPTAPAERIVAQLASMATQLVPSGAEVRARLVLGVGLPGLVDGAGVLCFAPNLPGLEGVAVREGLLERLGPLLAPAAADRGRLSGAALVVDNDATCAGAAEHAAGAARGVDDAVVVTLGTGIGGGIVAGGRLVRGARNFAGEVGHMVVEADGLLCPCGKRGCWERYASGSALARLAREALEGGRGGRLEQLVGGDAAAVRGEHVVEAAREGDAVARELLATLAWWLALGLGNLAGVLDPERIVVGGGLVEAGETLLSPLRSAFAEQLEGHARRPPIPVVAATLGERAGAIGAALLAAEGLAGPAGH